MKLILFTLFTLISVTFAIKQGQWYEEPKCDKDCTDHTKPVCLDGETVPYCYAKCMKKKPTCWKKCECCNCNKYGKKRVCGVDGKTYKNKCFAKCHGSGVKIKCKAPCDECCDRSIGKPVCACHKDSIKRYTNACYAMMLGVKKVFKCPHQCGTMYKPVCGTNGETYHNSCFAKVAKTAVECKHKCPCESMESPESFHWRENSAESIEDWRRK